jgi:hypothetical protein
VFELLKGDGRGGWASGSEWRKIKKSCSNSARFWFRVIHTLSTGYPHPVNISRLIHRLSTTGPSYPQVILDLSTGYSQANRGAEFSIRFRFDLAPAHHLPLNIGWIRFDDLLYTIWLWDWLITILTFIITRSEFRIRSYAISYIHLIIHHSHYTKTRTTRTAT